jgi:NRAMP (natural resistance-associated macrophage protein)-like metal ion transporter
MKRQMRDKSVEHGVPVKQRRRSLAVLGPGLITGASDDDPSGIATYSQAGAQFGYGMGWVMLFSYPLMASTQEISARIGRVTGHGIAGNIRAHYSRWLLRSVVGLLLVANVINIGADLGAMGDAIALLIGGPAALYVVVIALGCAWLEIFSRYARYVSILKWLTLSLLAYVAVVLVVGVPWSHIAFRTFVPQIVFTKDYLVAIVAVLGTTISPYLFFWQSSDEAEKERVTLGARSLRRAPEQAPSEFRRIRLDTYIGMGLSNLIGYCIILTTASTLNVQGVTDIQTSSQAAEALRPIAGDFAFAVFALGIIGTGLLAVPVLAGSAAYAVGEALKWRTGLGRRPSRAKAFYATVAVATLGGVGINFVDIDPIKALFWSAVINGVVAVPIMAIMVRLASAHKVMGRLTIPRSLRIAGWVSTAVMAAVVAAMFATWF